MQKLDGQLKGLGREVEDLKSATAAIARNPSPNATITATQKSKTVSNAKLSSFKLVIATKEAGQPCCDPGYCDQDTTYIPECDGGHCHQCETIRATCIANVTVANSTGDPTQFLQPDEFYTANCIQCDADNPSCDGG